MLLQDMRDRGVIYEIDTFQSGEELLDLSIEMNQYQVIFLDIKMDNIDGIMTARKIREQNEADEFINRIGDMLETESDSISTNHVIVDAILNTKYGEMMEKDIVLRFV